MLNIPNFLGTFVIIQGLKVQVLDTKKCHQKTSKVIRETLLKAAEKAKMKTQADG